MIDPQNAANVNGPSANSMYLGRPWGWQQVGGDAGTVFINTTMPAAIRAVGWLNWNANELVSGNIHNGGDPSKDSRYAEYNSVDSSNNPISTASRVAWSHQLVASQAAAFTVLNIFDREGTFPWYGFGYPAGDASNPGTGSANPSVPNYSWPAFWGDRNADNDTANSTIKNNPASYGDTNWTLAGNWDPSIQLATLPEPASLSLIAGLSLILVRSRRSRA